VAINELARALFDFVEEDVKRWYRMECEKDPNVRNIGMWQWILSKPLKFWRNKLRRKYKVPKEMVKAMLQWFTHWSGPAGLDPETGLPLINDRGKKVFDNQVDLAKRGYLSGGWLASSLSSNCCMLPAISACCMLMLHARAMLHDVRSCCKPVCWRAAMGNRDVHVSMHAIV
jgi:hypothetical protein